LEGGSPDRTKKIGKAATHNEKTWGQSGRKKQDLGTRDRGSSLKRETKSNLDFPVFSKERSEGRDSAAMLRKWSPPPVKEKAVLERRASVVEPGVIEKTSQDGRKKGKINPTVPRALTLGHDHHSKQRRE